MRYRRPEKLDTLFVWQVAVDEHARGKGAAGRMLDALAGPLSDVRHLETTITPGDNASMKLFARFAERWHANMDYRNPLHERQLGDDRPPETWVRISPLRPRRSKQRSCLDHRARSAWYTAAVSAYLPSGSRASSPRDR